MATLILFFIIIWGGGGCRVVFHNSNIKLPVVTSITILVAFFCQTNGVFSTACVWGFLQV